MKKQTLKRSEIIANTERLILENFHRVSKQLGMVTENLVKYVIYAKPFSYPTSKRGYFNKKLNKFIENEFVNEYPKEDFICNIDDVKMAKAIAAKTDFNPDGITWEQFRHFEDRFYRESSNMTENLDTLDDMKQYFNDVIQHLEVLDSGDKCINNARTNPNVISYIKNNFERGIPANKTAEHIRDSWYGV